MRRKGDVTTALDQAKNSIAWVCSAPGNVLKAGSSRLALGGIVPFQGSWSQAYIALLCSVRLHYIKIHSATFVKSGPLVYSLPFRPHYSGQILHCRLDGKQCRTVQPMQFCECITQCIAMFANTKNIKVQKYNLLQCNDCIFGSVPAMRVDCPHHSKYNTKHRKKCECCPVSLLIVR